MAQTSYLADIEISQRATVEQTEVWNCGHFATRSH